MPKLKIDITDYNLAASYASRIWVGSAFAFIDSKPTEDTLQAGLSNFYGSSKSDRRTLPLLPDGKTLPGFTVSPAKRPLKLAPVLLPDKEIYRAGQDSVKLLLVAPPWLFPNEDIILDGARLVVENNGAVYRRLPVELAVEGLTIVELNQLPEGSYRVYWSGDEATDCQGNPAECRFSVVEYVLSPLQATLLTHELRGSRLNCRLKIERYSEPLQDPVTVELWSGSQLLRQQEIAPEAPGLYQADFGLAGNAQERLELRIAMGDQTAAIAIPGSQKAERDETLLSGLGREVRVSLMPQSGSRQVRGLYISDDMAIANTPATLIDPTPENRRARLRWEVAAEAARLLVLDMSSNICEERELGTVEAGQELEIEVPAPGGFLAIAAWVGDKAWEGWSALLAPNSSQLEIAAPATASPGKKVKLKFALKSINSSLKPKTNYPAAVYVRVRDLRLSGASPEERLAASLKQGLQGAADWGTLAYIEETLDKHPDYPEPLMDFIQERGITLREASSGFPQASSMRFRSAAAPGLYKKGRASGAKSAIAPESFDDLPLTSTPNRSPRRDFADIAYCGVVETDKSGEATLEFLLPDAIATYTIEAFALAEAGREWSSASTTLEVSQPVWAEFKLPAFIYPGDKSPATLDIGAASGRFRLKLLRDGSPVPFRIAGAQQTSADTFIGERAKVEFEAEPGQWQAEIEDLTSSEWDIAERIVMALGQFKGITRRFQLLLAGETLDRRDLEALQLRLLPSLDKPFNLLCDATADYGHRCCEQTAAKLIAAVAALAAGGDPAKLANVIKAGVEREKRMHIPGRGLTMYPPEESGGSRKPDNYWGKLAADYLSGLAFAGEGLLASPTLDPEIKEALKTAIAIGEDAAAAYKLELVPSKIKTGRDAYRAAMQKEEPALRGIAKLLPGKKSTTSARNAALDYARDRLQKLAKNSTKKSGAVQFRQEIAYCAAALVAAGQGTDLNLAIAAANEIANSLDSNGRLYSTVDSVALIGLMAALQQAGIGGLAVPEILLDGRAMPFAEALELADAGDVQTISVQKGTASVEIVSELLEDWNAFRAELPVKVKLSKINANNSANKNANNNNQFHLGDNLELLVSIDRYEPGLLVNICLPSALSRLEGGGEVKRFSVDFCGKTELRIPLKVTGYTLPVGEHWAVLVRNMFKEEQAGSPGLLKILSYELA
ncbi:MAG: hypothetical protein F6J93_27465 [Oscillatoria sp. SIO1A7]|nr:hypothetical protein [Oscillatoria sp. SIO1A7]